MRQLVSQQEIHKQATAGFRKRTDVGLLNGIANSAMEPPNPFQERDKRRPKRGIILFLLLFGFFIVGFVYFNFVR